MAKYSPGFYAGRHRIAVIEQGFDVGREGRVIVDVMTNSDPYRVKTTGSAVRVGER